MNLLVCAGCHTVRYCNAAHQKAAWFEEHLIFVHFSPPFDHGSFYFFFPGRATKLRVRVLRSLHIHRKRMMATAAPSSRHQCLLLRRRSRQQRQLHHKCLTRRSVAFAAKPRRSCCCAASAKVCAIATPTTSVSTGLVLVFCVFLVLCFDVSSDENSFYFLQADAQT